MKKKLTAIFLCLVMAISLVSVTALADGGVTVTVYATNDMHGVVEESDSSIGLARVAALASGNGDILVDAGDATQGTSFATLTSGADVIKMMNAAGYDAMCAGNNEFDYGVETFLTNARAAAFPVLSANSVYNGSPLTDASTVITRSGFDIGFIGLTTSATASTVEPANLKGLTVGGELEAAKREIASLADKDVDAIVLICHLGDNASAVDTTSEELLAGLDDDELALVAAVVDGHSHTVEDGKVYTRAGRSIPIVQAGTRLSNLSRLTLTFTGSGVTAAGRPLSYDEVMAMDISGDDAQAAYKAVETALADVKTSQDKQLKTKLIDNKEPVWGGNVYWDYSENRIVETAYGDLVTDAFAAKGRAYAEAAGLKLPVIALENGGGIAQPMYKGEVTYGDILNAFNHGNTVEVLTVTPAQLYTALEVGLTMTGQDDTGLILRERVSGSFLQVSGFVYTYDPAGEAGAKVTDVTLTDGASLKRDDDKTQLLLATTNYVAGFDGLKDGRKLAELCGEDAAVQDWLAVLTENGAAALDYPITGDRIRYANDKSPETYEVSIPVLNSKEQGVPGVKVTISVDRGDPVEAVTDSEGKVTLTVSKGPHSISADVCDTPVYVNNYSGSGTVTTRTGYCQFGFPIETADPYADVKAGDWYWTPVAWAKTAGVLKDIAGSEFDPMRAVTRAEAVELLWRLGGGKQADLVMPFSDVPATASYSEAVRWAAAEGIVLGTGHGFEPVRQVTREELAVMIYRYERSLGGGFTGSWMFPLDYPDATDVSSWAGEAMHWCVMNGVITGSDGELRPRYTVTRSQAAAMLAKYDLISKKS